MTNKVLVLGGASYNGMIYLDDFPEAKSHTILSKGYHETIGSTGAGKALNLRKLGLQVTFHALIGDDEYGQHVKDYLSNAQVHFVYDVDPAGTKRHINLMDKLGRRISIFVAHGTFEPQIDRAALTKHIAASDLVAVNIINYCRHALPIIRAQHKPLWCDIHDYDGSNPYHQDFIDAADVLLLSSDSMSDYRPFMEKLIAQGKELVICTHGKEGATALTNESRWVETPIISAYQRVDSNGAGDSFFAGVLYGKIQGFGIEKCMRLGSVIGGLCITSKELAYPDLNPALVAAEYAKHYDQAL